MNEHISKRGDRVKLTINITHTNKFGIYNPVSPETDHGFSCRGVTPDGDRVIFRVDQNWFKVGETHDIRCTVQIHTLPPMFKGDKYTEITEIVCDKGECGHKSECGYHPSRNYKKEAVI